MSSRITRTVEQYLLFVKVLQLSDLRSSVGIQQSRQPRFARYVFIPKFFYCQGISLIYTNINASKRTVPIARISTSTLRSRIARLLIASIILAKFELYRLSINRKTFTRRFRLINRRPIGIKQNPINVRQALRYRPNPLINVRSGSDILRYILFLKSSCSRYSLPNAQILSSPLIG